MDYYKLVRECLAKKPEAQKQLYEHFSETMLGICYRYTKSLRDAEDVLQEGSRKARAVAQETMERVRGAVKLQYGIPTGL